MPEQQVTVIGGVDTHRDDHVAATVDSTGRLLGVASFPATGAGYGDLLGWMRGWGDVGSVGVEGTGSYGAGLARHLAAEGVTVVEVIRPNRQTRRLHGKSDPADAEAAARAVLSGEATVRPKSGDGPVEAIRLLHTTRRSAVKARTCAINQLKGHLVTAPEQVAAPLRGLPTSALIDTCARACAPTLTAATSPPLPNRRCASSLAATRRSAARSANSTPRLPACAPKQTLPCWPLAALAPKWRQLCSSPRETTHSA